MMNSLNLSEIERYLLNNNGAPKNDHLFFIVNDIKGQKIKHFSLANGPNFNKILSYFYSETSIQENVNNHLLMKGKYFNMIQSVFETQDEDLIKATLKELEVIFEIICHIEKLFDYIFNLL